MVVRSIGNSLMVILPDLIGKKITNWFDLVRPLISFKFETVSFPSSIAAFFGTVKYLFLDFESYE